MNAIIEKRLAAVKVNLSKGNWAVAVTGMKGWRNDFAIGDGITKALNALVTRTETESEARDLARLLNSAQPEIRPGGQSVFVYEAMEYQKESYLSRQDLGLGRDCDRRIARI